MKEAIVDTVLVLHMFRRMGQRNPTRRELLEHAFPVRLTVRVPPGQDHRVDRALRRVLGWQAHGQLGGVLYLTSLRHASGFVCACPDMQLDTDWPLRLTLAFETTQEWLVRDAWDGVQFMRMAHPARLVAERHVGRNG